MRFGVLGTGHRARTVHPAAQEGQRRLEGSGLTMRVFTSSVDDGLNYKAYIVPGLGDAGDRQFGAV